MNATTPENANTTTCSDPGAKKRQCGMEEEEPVYTTTKPLTYGRWRRFLEPEQRPSSMYRRVSPSENGEYVPKRDRSYDCLLEIYHNHILVGYGVKKLDDFRFDWAEVNFRIQHFSVPDWRKESYESEQEEDEENNESEEEEEHTWIRLVLRSNPDGKMTTILHNRHLTCWTHSSCGLGRDDWNAQFHKELTYHIGVGAMVSFVEDNRKFNTASNASEYDFVKRQYTEIKDKTEVKVKFYYIPCHRNTPRIFGGNMH